MLGIIIISLMPPKLNFVSKNNTMYVLVRCVSAQIKQIKYRHLTESLEFFKEHFHKNRIPLKTICQLTLISWVKCLSLKFYEKSFFIWLYIVKQLETDLLHWWYYRQALLWIQFVLIAEQTNSSWGILIDFSKSETLS